MKYKVGDKVRIKNKEWYEDNCNRYGILECGDYEFFEPMNEYCGQVVTITRVDDCYRVNIDKGAFCWTDEMIEGLAKESDDFEKMYMESEKRYEEEYSKGEYCHEQSFKWGFQEGYNYSHENDKLEILLKEGYQFIDENGNVINATKIVLEKKKKEYPKTYKECCEVLGIEGGRLMFNNSGITQYERELYIKMNNLSKLLICRDAYWKIAGEEMGLGKPWKPKLDNNEMIYFIYNVWGKVYECECFEFENRIFAFPTEEMRDAFYENFKEKIEICKGLL